MASLRRLVTQLCLHLTTLDHTDRCIRNTFTQQVSVLCIIQAATALGLELLDVKQADQKGSQAVHGTLSKKTTAATPVPAETVIVPVPTVPAVAVSGTDPCIVNQLGCNTTRTSTAP